MSYLPGYITRRAGGVRRATTNGWWPAIDYRHQPDPDPPPAKTKRHVLEIVSGGCWEGSHSGGGRVTGGVDSLAVDGSCCDSGKPLLLTKRLARFL